ncbi:DUF3159 domain-containing protein [Streptomyces sp. NBC_01456]|uniref:DUF3159 domain-containing protein n=1 Tax=unclassified Streptomyces TaxID=2593676 RepID=UPI002E364DA3|nr:MULTISPECIES: DUF3159 domain-containing protein [unclassified Streptomyces]
MDRAVHPEAGSEDAAQAAVRSRLRSGMIDVAPFFGFTLSLAATHRVAVALTVALTVGAGACVVRLVRREPVRRTLGVLGLLCVGGALAATTGQATSFFLPSLVVHCVMAVATPVLLLLGWPPMGLAVGLITGEKTRWRRCPVRRRAFTRGNLAILAGNYATLAIQLPLFLSGQAVALGTVEVFSPIVLAIGTLLGWRIYRRVVGTHRCADSRLNTATPPTLERTAS